jgi:hypothetical protein
VKAVCSQAGWDGITITFRYDTDTLALVECEVEGTGMGVVAKATREDGTQDPWEGVFDAPGIQTITGLDFAGLTPDGFPYGILFVMYPEALA